MKPRTTRSLSIRLILVSLIVTLLAARAVCFALPDGDVDGDNRVTGIDALLILRAYIGLDPVTARIVDHGIITIIGPDHRPHPSGHLSMADPLLVLKKAIGLISWDYSDPGQVNQPPTANAGSNQTIQLNVGENSRSITLVGSGNDPDGTIASYLWAGTPTPTAVQNPSVALGAGTHTFSLVVTDNQGAQSAASTVTITINAAAPPINQPPTANAGPNQTITLNSGETSRSVSLAGSGSDPDGTIVSYLWSGIPTPAAVQNPSVGLGVGTHTFTLIVTDNQGAQSAAATVTITINAAAPPANQPPTANAGTNQTIILASGQTTATVTLDGSGSADSDGTIAGYNWNGTPTPSAVAAPSVTLGVGTHTFTLVVTDNQGAQSAVSTVIITVNPAPVLAPVILTQSLPAGLVGSSYAFGISASDPAGNAVTYSIEQGPAGMSINPASGLLSWQPAAGDIGIAQVVITVTNTSGGIGRRSFSVTVPDTIAPSVSFSSPPVQLLKDSTTTIAAVATDNRAVKSVSFFIDGVSQAIVTAAPYQFNLTTSQTPGTVLTVRAVAEDTSGNTATAETGIAIYVENANNRAPQLAALNATYTLAEGESLTIPVTATDLDAGDVVSLVASTTPPSLANSFFNAGIFTFSPGFTQAGSYSVTFRAVDPSGLTDQKTIQITVTDVNRQPSITTQSLTNGRVDFPYSATITATDPDSDPLTFSLSQGPTGMTINTATGILSWRPVIGDIGSYTFTVAVSDGKGGNNSRQYTLQVPDSILPTVSLSAPTEAIPGASFKVVASAADNKGVTSVTIVVAGQAPVELTTAPYEQQLTLPDTLAVGAAVAISATAKDAAGNSSSASASVKIVAVPDTVNPTVSLTAPATVYPGSRITVTAVSSDNQGVAGLDFTVGGVAIGTAGAAAPSISYQVPAAAAIDSTLSFSVTARDFSGNSASAQAQATVVAAPVIPDTTAPTVSLSVPASIAVGSLLPVTISASDGGGVASVELLLAHNRVAYFTNAVSQTMSLPLPEGAAAGMELVVELLVSDQSGNPATASATVSVVTRGQGVLTGAVYDDVSGQPLSGATVTLALSGQTEQSATTDSHGRYSFVADEGTGGLIATKAGYNRVDRSPVAVMTGTGRRVADARLTPLPATGSALSAVLGGTIVAPFTPARGGFASAIKEAGIIAAPTGGMTVTFPSGALAADQSLILVQAGAQGLQGTLPAGWSPVAAFDLQPHGINFAAPVAAAVPNLLGITVTAGSVAARWDESSHSWLTVGAVAVAADGATLVSNLPATGQYIFLTPDAGSGAPSAPAAGAPLSSVPLFPLGQDLQAQVTPQPKLIFYKPGVSSAVGSRVAAAQPLVSGTPVWATIAEDYRFYSGDRIVAEPYAQDIVLYTFGLPAGALLADYPVAPSQDFTGQLLEKGVISVTTSILPANADIVTVVGPQGGAISTAGGEALIIPAGAVNRTVPVVIKPFDLPASGLTLPPGFTLLGGVTFSMPGSTLQAPVALSLSLPGSFTEAGDILLVRPIAIGGATQFAVIGRGTVNSGRLLSTVEVPGSTTVLFPGITTEGSVFFLQSATGLGYVGGTVSGTSATPFSGALVGSDTLPLVAVSGSSGGYVTVVTSGAFTLTARDTVKMDAGSATGSVLASAFAALNLSLAIDAPRVVAVTPANNAINITLTDPVVISLSEPVIAAAPVNVQVTTGAADTPTIVNGSVELSVDGMAITFRHPDLFASNTIYTVSVSGLVDRSGTTMTAPFSATFTSLNTDPPVAPPAANISATIPGVDGATTVSGTQGSAGIHDTVTVVNLTTGARNPALVDPDGSFSTTFAATVKDKLQLEITSPAGITTTVVLPRFQQKNPDGSITAYFAAEGGRLTVGTTFVDVPQGAFPEGTSLKVQSVAEADMGMPPLADFPFVAGLDITTTAEPQKYLNVSAPLPPGTQPEETGVVVKVIDAFGAPAYAMVDTAKVIDGRLATSSPPCPGVVPAPGIPTPDGIQDRVNRYAILLNHDQEMRYERVLTTIYPPKYVKESMVMQAFLMPLGSTGFPMPMYNFVLDINTTRGTAFDTLCLVLPPDQKAAFVFRDARSGAVVTTIPATTPAPTGSGSTLAITYVNTSDTIPPRMVDHRPTSNMLSMINRSIELRFSEAIKELNITDAIKLLDPANGNAEVAIDITLTENNSVITVTPKQLLPMGQRFRLTITNLKDLAGNVATIPFMDFYTYSPKMVFPSATSRLDRAKVAADLGISTASLALVSLNDLDISTTPPEKSSDGKWHTSMIGIANWWGVGYGDRVFTFNADDPTMPKTLAGYPGNPKYLQKVQYLRNVSLLPRDVPATATWRGRELHYLTATPENKICADPTSSAGAAEILKWETVNKCAAASGTCTTKTGGCGDLAVVTGHDPVYGQLWSYDVTNLSAPNWGFGYRLLSDNGQDRGYPPRPHTPAGFGMVSRFSLLENMDITHKGGLVHPNALGAFVAVPGIGLELVDLGLNMPEISEMERVPSVPLTMNEQISGNPGGLYYQDVQVIRGKVVAIAGDNIDHTGIAAIETFGTDLSGPKSMLALGHIPRRMTAVEGFLSYDGNGDGVAEPHDVAFVVGSNGGLSVVEIPALAGDAMNLLAFMKTPAGTIARHIEVDAVEKVAYISASFPENGITKQGILVADVSRLGASVVPVIDSTGWDSRIFGRIPVSTFASGNVTVRGFRLDKQRGLLFAGIEGDDAMVVFKVAECADLGVDFAEAAPQLPLPLEVEKRALQTNIRKGLDNAGVACGAATLSGITMIEQGSGACLWKNTCKSNYQPGISDHDYEIFFPASVPPGSRDCVIKKVAEQFTELASNEPVELVQDGYKIKFDDISFFPMSKEEFETAELNVNPPTTTTGDVTGDMGLGRQMLLLKWLVEGTYVTIPGYTLSGKDFSSILSLVRRANPAVPANPILDEPSRIKRLEGYEWAKLQEAEFYGTGALIRFVDEVKPGTTLQHGLEKQLHKVAKAGIRGVLARMIADTKANRYVLTNANGNVHDRLECLAVPPSSPISDWTPEPCDSFEHFIASVAARTVRDERMTIFTEADITDMVYPLYRMKAGKEHLTKEDEVNRFIARAARFITALADASGPAGTVFNATIGSDSASTVRISNVDKAATRAATYKTGGKKQIVPRLFNRGGRGSTEFAVRMYDGTELAKEKISLQADESRHLNVKKVPDPADPTGATFITKKIFSLSGINQTTSSSGNRWVDFLVDLPEKLIEEPERKNNWGKLYYYVLDPLGSALPPTPSTAALPIPDPAGTLLKPDNVCLATSPGLRVEQLVDGVRVDSAALYIDGTCKNIDIVATNTSAIDFTNVQIYSSIANHTYSAAALPAGASQTFTYNYCPMTTVGSQFSLVVPTADDVNGKPIPLPVNIDTVTLNTLCPIVIEPLEPDPNPELSEIMVGGTFYRYYQVYDYRHTPAVPVVAANVSTEFIGTSFITRNYTTDNAGYIVDPSTPATGPETGMAVPWSTWGIPVLTASTPIQATIKIPGTCAEPVKFMARLKMLEFEESIKAGAKLDLGASLGLQIGLGGTAGLELGWKGTHAGGTGPDTLNSFSLARSMGVNGSLGAKTPEAKLKVSAGGRFSAKGPELSGSVKFAPSLQDKFEYALPLSEDDKLRIAGLISDTVAVSNSTLLGPLAPVLNFLTRKVNDYFTDFMAARTSTGIVGAFEVSGSASLFDLGLRFGSPDKKGISFGVTGSATEQYGFSATIEELVKENKTVNTGELFFDLNLALGMDAKMTEVESELVAGPPDPYYQEPAGFSPVAVGFKEIAKLGSLASGTVGFSSGIKFKVVQDPANNMRPDLLEITYKGKGEAGAKVMGNSIVDLGPGFRRNRTYSVSKTREIFRVLNRMANFNLLMDAAAASYLSTVPPSSMIIGPSEAAKWISEFIAMVLNDTDYTENIEKTGKVEIPLGFDAALGAGLKLEIAIGAEYALGYAKEKGKLSGGKSLKLEDYSLVNLAPQTAPAMVGRMLNFYTAFSKLQSSFRSTLKDINNLIMASSGSAQLQFTSDVDFKAVDGMMAFDFTPLSGPVELRRYAPVEMIGPASKPHYGIGGFEQFVPVAGNSGTFSAPATLTFHYHDTEVAGLDENNLAIYRYNQTSKDWDLLGGTLDTTAKTMTVPVTATGLYTMAPPMPSGTFQWTVDSLTTTGAKSPDEKTFLTVSAGPFTNNNGSPVPAGTVFHVSSVYPGSFDDGAVNQGTVLTTDAVPAVEGTQLMVGSDGKIHLSMQYGPGAGSTRIIGFSDLGTSFGNQVIPLVGP